MDLQVAKSESPSVNRRKKTQFSKRIPRIGWVVFSKESGPVHCAVKEFHQDRAILTMSGWLGLPSSFTLYVEPDSVRAHCKVVKCSGSVVEVSLSELENGVRFRASHPTAA